MDYHKILCKNFQAFYVPGVGGFSESNSSQTLERIRETIFGLDYDEDRLKFVRNSESGFTWIAKLVNTDLTKTIKDFAKSHSCNRCGKISFIIFGHSHGGEMVVRAFESMEEEMSTSDFKKLRDRSAVITMGSIKYIKSNQAKITLNVLLENDDVAKTAAGLVTQNGAEYDNNFLTFGPVNNYVCQCCKKRGKPTEGKLKDEGSLSGMSCGFSALSKISSHSNSSGVSKSVSDATSGIGHYSTEYVACKNLRKHIREKLGFSVYPIVCGCSD